MAVGYTKLFDRRHFMKGAGAAFAALLTTGQAEAIERSDVLFASATKNHDGSFSAVLLDASANILKTIALPSRGHDVVFNPMKEQAVAFARRPGTFAISFPTTHAGETSTITSPIGRHFYGHGVFSPDGKILYATENAFEEGIGKIGIYDATRQFHRLGELDSYGIGPHEILLLPNGQTLVVANGGIETHPDYGREKLNIATMEPSISFIDRKTGDLLERHTLPSKLHQLSIRHMDVSPNGTVVFGSQYEGSMVDNVPLVGKLTLGEPIRFFNIDDQLTARLKNYIGSVAVSQDGLEVAVTAPKGNLMLQLSMTDPSVLNQQTLSGVFGVAKNKQRFIATTDQGLFDNTQISGFDFDNHLTASA